MNDPKNEKLDNNNIRPKPITARRKRLYFLALIALILLGAIPVIGFLRQSETAKRLEGLGVALCAIAWGIFLIRHFVQVVEEEDRVEEELINTNQATISSLETNPTERKTNPTTPPPDAGQNIK
jgi:hypothetical protein